MVSFHVHCFLLAQYPHFDTTLATDDLDVIVLSLCVFHGMIVKSCESFMQHACHMEPGLQKLIMDFLDNTLSHHTKLSVQDIEYVIQKINPGKCQAFLS